MQDPDYGERRCIVEGCAKPAQPVGKYFDRYCGMHRARITRHGSPHVVYRRPLTPQLHTNGYMVQYLPDHPLAMKSGVVYVHRLVLYEHIGAGAHSCHWCAGEVRWGSDDAELVPDHLDNVKTNNDRDNLVASCRPCNTRRSSKGRPAPNRKDVDLDVLYRLADSGTSKAETARRLGVSESLVRLRLKQRA